MPKKDEKVRIVANFKRTVNTVLSETSDKYQLPDSDILFQEIGLENNFFATLDIKQEYWQFEIRPEDRHKTKILGEVKNNKSYRKCPINQKLPKTQPITNEKKRTPTINSHLPLNLIWRTVNM